MILTTANLPSIILIEPATEHKIIVWCSPGIAPDLQTNINSRYPGVKRVFHSPQAKPLVPGGSPYARLSVMLYPDQESGPVFDRMKRWLSVEAIISNTVP